MSGMTEVQAYVKALNIKNNTELAVRWAGNLKDPEADIYDLTTGFVLINGNVLTLVEDFRRRLDRFDLEDVLT